MGQFITVSIAVFLIIILLLVVMLLVAKKYLSPSGKVTITINGDKKVEVDMEYDMAKVNQAEANMDVSSASADKAIADQNYANAKKAKKLRLLRLIIFLPDYLY